MSRRGIIAISWFSISKTNLRYAGGPDAGGRGGDGDGEQLPDGGVHVVHLGNKNIFIVTFHSGDVSGHLGDEDSGDGLVQSGAVHVDRGADGEDESEHGTWSIT